MNTTSGRESSGVPDLILEQYRLGELSRDEADRVERLLSVDVALRARHDALDRSDEAIARSYPVGWLAQRVRARLPELMESRSLGWRGRLSLAAAAALVLLAIPVWRASIREDAAPAAAEDRLKGLSPALTIYRRTAAGSETLADGSVARAGDLLRVGYTGAGRTYGIILSIDGRGVVTLHLPPNGDRAARLKPGHATLLDQAYELDDAPGWERFYFVTGETSFAVTPVVDAAKKAVSDGARRAPVTLPLSRELTQSTFSLQKEVRP
jgi:hypothetical protein